MDTLLLHDIIVQRFGSSPAMRTGQMIKVRIRKRIDENRVVRNIEDIPLAAEDIPNDYEGEGNPTPEGRIATNEPITIVYEPQIQDTEYEAIQARFDNWVSSLTPKHNAKLRATISKRICPATPTMQSLIVLFRKWSAASKGQVVKDK